MYRQILVDREDQNLQLIVWRESKDSPIREYKLCTVTFGTASASYLATRCLFQVGLELERDNPTVSSLIKESFYIDDLMAGATSSEEAITSIKTLSQVLEARGFHLRKWRSNSPDVLSRISSNWVGNTSNLEIHPDECSKALGLTWNSVKDTFIFNLKVNFPDNITKRSFLSQSARLFDPLGFLTPCTVYIKIFYQQLWLLKLDWDSPLPDALATKWKTFRKEFEQICSIHIPRWIHTVSQQVTLHGFCDASELAYASVIYAVQPQADGNTKVTLLVAKSRVAPLKPVSIPRLELNGALLLARLYATCKNIFKEYDVHLYAWTDSQVVLSWLSSHPRNWKPYIGNRTSEILDLVPADSWRYVPTKMIPADIASRGLSPKELPRCGLWWEGPQWLSCGMDSWPKQPKRDDQTSLMTRERKRTAFSFPVSVNCDFIDSLFLKFSSFYKIIDIFAFCFRYITNCKARVGKMKSNLDFKGKCHVPPLTTYERRQASNNIFSYIQNLFFKEEINCLKANKPVANKSILSALCPFIDRDGLIRVGGRLRNSTPQYSAKHPIILPNQHEICNLIVNMYHILYLHAGCNVLLGIIKQNYWIIGIKKIVKKCIICCRYRATTSKQLMGDLPAHRVTPSRPFSACGVDYAGPINVLRYRASKIFKKGYAEIYFYRETEGTGKVIKFD
ncbi:integrase catalytic domain-containing protein [Trichonephila clavata]|uniref:Integrase catalytic domain-containing protein n=1 Tax=Trichonephila clavata TaxID=2740835 RepID=A0A8X6H9Y1_TRICU|nr:integrase catalytic domain-containing protein [Trichonephila clavata]